VFTLTIVPTSKTFIFLTICFFVPVFPPIYNIYLKDKARQGKTRQVKTRQEKTRQEVTRYITVMSQ